MVVSNVVFLLVVQGPWTVNDFAVVVNGTLLAFGGRYPPLVVLVNEVVAVVVVVVG